MKGKGFVRLLMVTVLTLLFSSSCYAAETIDIVSVSEGKAAFTNVAKSYLADAGDNNLKGWVDKNGNSVKASSSKKLYYYKNGKRLTGIQVIKGKFYQFNSKGKFNSAKTKKLQKAAKYEANFKSLKKLIGKPKKSKYSVGCYGKSGKDGILTYKNFVVYTFRYSSGKEIYFGAEAK